MKSFLRILLIIVLSLVLIGMVVGSIFAVNLFSSFKIVKKTDISVSAVLEKVKLISQLDTVELYYNEILDYRSAIEINEFEIPFTEKSFIFFVKATVEAGVDLSSLTEADIQIEDKK
jgi:hypothetical protein